MGNKPSSEPDSGDENDGVECEQLPDETIPIAKVQDLTLGLHQPFTIVEPEGDESEAMDSLQKDLNLLDKIDHDVRKSVTIVKPRAPSPQYRPFRNHLEVRVDGVPQLLADKLKRGLIDREEHDAILRVHAMSTAPPPLDLMISPEVALATAANSELKVLCTTFNMGNTAMDQTSLNHWLGTSADLCSDVVAIALQETWGSTSRVRSNSLIHSQTQTQSHTSHASSPSPSRSASSSQQQQQHQPTRTDSRTASVTTTVLIANTLGDFEKIVEVSRGQMRLLVFVRRAMSQLAHSVETSAENTGALFGTLPNKGGLVAKIVVGTTSLAFVGCHLCAHEGEKHFKTRNTSCAEILEGARLGNTTMDVTQFHHCFFIGDLNYRVDFGYNNTPVPINPVPVNVYATHHIDDIIPFDSSPQRNLSLDSSANNLTRNEQLDLAYSLIEMGDLGLQRLYTHDELSVALDQGLALCGFTTSQPPSFPPTFKTKFGEVTGYNPKRLPSWCDRILWQSLPAYAFSLDLLEYTSVPQAISSDHKPVKAHFRIRPSPTPELVDVETRKISLVAHLTGLHATGLSELDGILQGGMSDPYIEVYSDPAFAHPPAITARTKVISKCLNPVWDEPLVVPLHVETVVGVHLFLVVKDHDLGKSDDVIGVVCISLEKALRPSDIDDDDDDDDNQQGHITFVPSQSNRKRQMRPRRGCVLEGTHLHPDRLHFAFSEMVVNNGLCHGQLNGVCEVIATDVTEPADSRCSTTLEVLKREISDG